MKKAVFQRLSILFTLFLLVVGFFISIVLMQNNEASITTQYETLLKSVSVQPLPEDKDLFCDNLSALFGGLRITAISQDGTVLGDSVKDAETLTNHSDRTEVKDAIKNGSAVSKRYSETMGQQMLYIAYRTNDGIILRAAIPADTLDSYLLTILFPLLVCLLLSIIIALMIADYVARSAARPLAQVADELRSIEAGDYACRLEDTRYDEMVPLVRGVNRMADSVETAVGELREERSKLELLLNSMRQGLMVLSNDFGVQQMNDAARRILGVEQGRITQYLHELTHSADLLSAAESCLVSGISSLFDLSLDDGDTIYSVSVTPLNSAWLRDGALILLTDVTRDRKAEKMRAEFVSNASHELKTPVTSIRGFAELLSSGLVEEETQRDDYLGRIVSESDRLSAIIDDILKLSSLEEQPIRTPDEMADPLAAAQTVAEELSSLCAAKNVTVTVSGDSAPLRITEDDMYRLLKNLMENAVKYNREGGKVTVTIADENTAVALTVKDTGIGISETHLPRIFERFYRVDKGRSRSVGGTGLGLSIVKHIVSDYGGQIETRSTPDVGTQITVRFPKR